MTGPPREARRSASDSRDSTSAPLLRKVAPQPAERLGQERAAVLVRVGAVAELEAVVVAAELARRRHLLVRERPVPVLVVEVVRAVLQEDAHRPLRVLADQSRVDVAATDVREAADVADHLAKGVGPLPRDGERADAARAHTHDPARV